MKRALLPRLLLLAVLAAIAGGGVVAWAAGTGPDSDPAPPAARADVPGLVSLARPIAPIAIKSTPPAVIDLLAKTPDGRQMGVASFNETRTRTGRSVDRACLMPGPLAQLRAARFAMGNCLDASTGEPWAITTSASSEGPVVISGVASSRVKRLTIAGPGGTFVLPRSEGGAFYVVYGKRATGRAVLTGTLTDGTTRFFRSSIPPSFRSPGLTEAKDPDGLPAWVAGASTMPPGSWDRRTCVNPWQESAIRARTRLGRGGVYLAAFCGDLTRHVVFARTTTLRPGRQASVEGASSVIPLRTILAGAASTKVKEVAVTGPGGRRVLPLADAGRAFLAVYPATVSSADLTLEVTLSDSRVERYVNPAVVNGAKLRPQPPRLIRLTLRVNRPDPRFTRIAVTLDRSAPRVNVRIRGRTVDLRRTSVQPGRATYVALYRPPGNRRPWTAGAIHAMTLGVCGAATGGCSTSTARARVR